MERYEVWDQYEIQLSAYSETPTMTAHGCGDCGVLVFSQAAHDRFHAEAEKTAPTAPE